MPLQSTGMHLWSSPIKQKPCQQDGTLARSELSVGIGCRSLWRRRTSAVNLRIRTIPPSYPVAAPHTPLSTAASKSSIVFLNLSGRVQMHGQSSADCIICQPFPSAQASPWSEQVSQNLCMSQSVVYSGLIREIALDLHPSAFEGCQ